MSTPRSNRPGQHQTAPPELRHAPEIHVLFLDIVSFSRRLSPEQYSMLRELQDIVCGTAAYEMKGDKLLIRETGDGMALVFFTGNCVPAVECAEEITRKLEGRDFSVRMGIHSGLAFRIPDVNDQDNVAGIGINTAQRVMDCGDAGHILVTESAAECLRESPVWKPRLHDLKEVRVKHDQLLRLYNLHDRQTGLGNPAPPGRVAAQRRQRWLRRATTAALLLALAGAISALIWLPRGGAAAAQSCRTSVAVLPFTAPGDEEEYRTLAESIRLGLKSSDLPLNVLPETSVAHLAGRPPQEAARNARAQIVVHGQIMGDRGRRTVLVKIFRDGDAEYVVGKYLENELKWHVIQQNVSLDVANQLSQIFTAGRAKGSTANTAAHEAYKQGLALLEEKTPEAMRRATEKFEEAVRNDPDFAWAHLKLADCYISRSFSSLEPGEGMPKARRALERARELLPDRAETVAGFAMIKFWYERQDADAEFRRAISLNPENYALHNRYGVYLLTTGKRKEALDEILHSLDIGSSSVTMRPPSPALKTTLGQYYYFTGQHDKAVETLKELAGFAAAHRFLGQAHHELKNPREAIKEIRVAYEKSRGDPDVIAALSYVYGRTGDRRQAEKLLEEFNRLDYKPPFNLALIYAGLGEQKYGDALQALRESVTKRDVRAVWIEIDPRLRDLKEKRRAEFDAIVAELRGGAGAS